MERKHNILPSNDEVRVPNAKRKRAALDNDDNYSVPEHHIPKRTRPNANSTAIQERSPIGAITPPRPVTPSTPPPAIGDLTNNNGIQPASTSQIVCAQNEGYNVIHISDRELNKFMQSGRVEVKNGMLILKDSDEQEEEEEKEEK